jgi:hypothetical protein
VAVPLSGAATLAAARAAARSFFPVRGLGIARLGRHLDIGRRKSEKTGLVGGKLGLKSLRGGEVVFGMKGEGSVGGEIFVVSRKCTLTSGSRTNSEQIHLVMCTWSVVS